MEKICKNCKFWERNKGYFANVNGKQNGTCSCNKLYYRDGHTKEESDTLVYCDHEEYDAWLNTGENFGCIHFEYKLVII